jgi:hypothetical protein
VKPLEGNVASVGTLAAPDPPVSPDLAGAAGNPTAQRVEASNEIRLKPTAAIKTVRLILDSSQSSLTQYEKVRKLTIGVNMVLLRRRARWLDLLLHQFSPSFAPL